MGDRSRVEERLFEWDAVLDDSSYYELLGVLEIADDQAIRDAFHAFAGVFHPDLHLDGSEEVRSAVRRVWQRGAEGYRVLSNPELRLRYDLALAQGHLRLQPGDLPPSAAFPHGARRLVELCATGAGKLHAQRAEEAISSGDLRAALRELKLAAFEEGANADPELAERIDAVDLALFASGD